MGQSVGSFKDFNNSLLTMSEMSVSGVLHEFSLIAFCGVMVCQEPQKQMAVIFFKAEVQFFNYPINF